MTAQSKTGDRMTEETLILYFSAFRCLQLLMHAVLLCILKINFIFKTISPTSPATDAGLFYILSQTFLN